MNDHKFPAAQVNAEIKRWQERLGLKDWQIDWCIGDEYSYPVKNECFASVHFALGGRNANICFSPFCPHWKSSLKHEILEILLADLQGMADPKYQEWQIEAVKHSIIRRLEKVLR
jgi:hypothetical protein